MNHLSDSVSIVDVATPSTPRVDAHAARRRRAARHRVRRRRAATAPSSRPRTAARTRAGDPQLTTAGRRPRRRLGVRRRPTSARRSAARRSTIVTLFGDTPRALAVSARRHDASTPPCSTPATRRPTVVRAASVTERRRGSPGPPPTSTPTDVAAAADRPDRQVPIAPDGTALGRRARPRLGRRGAVHAARPRRVRDRRERARRPSQIGRAASFAGVGTMLFNMVVNPVSGKVYVTNTEARNEVRFEGPEQLRRRQHGARPPRREPHHGARRRRRVTPRHLNKHIDYDVVPSPPATKANEPRDPDRHGGHERRRDALRRRLRLEQDRRLRHRRARERHASCPTRPTTSRVTRRRPDRPRARRGARPRSTCSRASTTRISVVDTGDRRRDRRTCRCTTPSRRASSTGRPLPLRRRAHLEQRRGGVRELPHLRRLRQPRLGPRQSGRRGAQQPEPVHASPTAVRPRSRTSIR